MEANESHIRNCMLYEFKRKSTAAEATRNICSAWGDVLNERTCRRWFQKFRSGDFRLEDGHYSGRPREFDIDFLRTMVETDPRLTIQEMSERLNASVGTVHKYLHALGKTNRQGIWVPHELSLANREHRVDICSSLLSRQENDPFLGRVVTGDEKWVLYVNVKRKKQWLSRGQKPLPTPKSGLHPVKVMLCVWWDKDGIIHFELLDSNLTVTSDVYCQQLERLRQALVKKRPALVNRKGIILLHDKPDHTFRR
jgi:[histone H3]-lysine36 N-dimethyltransferase SETMAR